MRRILWTAAIAWLGLAGQAAAEEAPERDAEAGEAEADAPLAGYDGAFFIQSPDKAFKLKIQGRVQARYTFESLEMPRDERTEESAFSIPRARFKLGGHVFTDALTYKFQADFGKGAVTLKDFYADYRVVDNLLHLRVGQWKRPFSRQQITSSGRLEFADRAITDDFFDAGRDIGVALHNNYEKSPGFEWALGVFNGTGDKGRLSGDVQVDPATGDGRITSAKQSNVPALFNPTLAARIGFNHGGIKGYAEPDLEGGPLRAAVGLSGLSEFDADDDDQSAIRGELDFIIKAYGFDMSGAAYVSSEQNGASFDQRRFEAFGLHAQAGYVIAGLVQPVLRYALVAPEGDANDVQEAAGGVTLYVYGHQLKWTTELAGLLSETPGADLTDYQLRSQLQLAF